jgi:hypothetical protein
MNERIKELARQAESFAETALVENYGGMQAYFDIVMAKFSELIVNECIEVVKQDMYSGMGDHSDYSLGVDHALQIAIGDIKEHFGVEE